MLENEAESNLGPRNTKHKKYLSVKRAVRNYNMAICILFTIVALLCMNYISIYKSYMDIRHGFNAAVERMKSVTAIKKDSGDEVNILKKNNEFLKNEYKRIMAQNDEILKQIQQLRAANDELAKKNRELVEDNIELQNSVKTAASVGIKPQNYVKFNGISSRSEFERGTYLGKFLGTAYTPSKDECGNNNGITNSGKPIIPGISIAVDNKYWPFGTIFYIKGLGYSVAMDTGSAIKGKNRFDFAVFDKKFAEALGSKSWDVFLIKKGNGMIGEVTFFKK